MKLKLSNVGKIRKAEIEFNGITVIAGENDTGKSTVGKMFFCVFHSFYKIQEQINEERQKTIARVIATYYHEAANRLTRGFNTIQFARYIVENRERFLENKQSMIKELEEFYLSADSHFDKYMDQESLKILIDKIYSFLKVEDSAIRENILRKRIAAEFAMKTGYLNRPDEKTEVSLEIKNGKVDFEISNNDDIVIHRFISLVKKIIYIDDPFVLDNLNANVPLRMLNNCEHSGELLYTIANGESKDEFSVVDELVRKEKLQKIFEAMDGVCDGSLIEGDGGQYIYRTSQLEDSLEMVNLSTGMKSFIIIKKLLENGSIEENGVLILDEPEIHLHPEWQLKFAEVIVLIQKEFGINILLNTHSPYFLNAIEVFSEKHGIDRKCSYYLTDVKNGRTDILDVTQSRELIYDKLAEPLQKLENLEYRNGNTI